MNARLFLVRLGLALALLAGPASAQTATISGSLGNFDVINDSGHDAHGFEIEIDGLQPNDVSYAFSVERYGAPVIVPTATGITVRWSSSYDGIAQRFAQATIPHVPGAPFAGTCYQWNGAAYDTAGCEHFGVSLLRNSSRTVYRWLIEDPAAPGTLAPVNPPVPVASATYYVQPPAQGGGEPVLVAEVDAPEPAERPDLYGDAQWMKVFVTKLPRAVSLDELMSDNPIVPQDAAQTEVSWDVVQAEPAALALGNGNHKRSRKRNQGGIDARTRSVVRRYELYTFTGAYDPLTHEALCADLTCSVPGAGELGEMVSAQMTAANVQADSLTVARSGNGSVTSGDKRIACGNACTSYYDAGAVVTLTAKAASGTVFAGWTGACAGAAATCDVTIAGETNVGATFTTLFNLSVGVSNKGSVTSDPAGIACGAGGSCSSKFAQGSVVTLTAVPPAGKSFVGWSGGCTGSASTCDVTIGKDTSVQAAFSK